MCVPTFLWHSVRRVVREIWVEDIRYQMSGLGQRDGGCRRMGARGRVEKMPEAAAKGVVWWCGVVLAGRRRQKFPVRWWNGLWGAGLRGFKKPEKLVNSTSFDHDHELLAPTDHTTTRPQPAAQ